MDRPNKHGQAPYSYILTMTRKEEDVPHTECHRRHMHGSDHTNRKFIGKLYCDSIVTYCIVAVLCLLVMYSIVNMYCNHIGLFIL